VTYGGGTWVVTGTGDTNGNLWVSQDGSGWENIPAFRGGTPRYTVYENGVWIVTGFDDAYSQNMWYSSNGTTWNSKTVFPNTSFSNGDTGRAVYRNGTWVVPVVGNPGMYYSKDGSEWIGIYPNYALRNAFYGNNSWVVIDEAADGFACSDDNGVNWQFISAESESFSETNKFAVSDNIESWLVKCGEAGILIST
jgi:hypothetical protein